MSEQAGVLSLVQGHFDGMCGCLVSVLSAGMMKTRDLLHLRTGSGSEF